MLGVRDKVVVIANASGGLGRALAYTFAQNRAHTYFSGKDGKELEGILETIKEKNFTATPIEADVSGERGIGKIVETVSHKHSQIDVIVFIMSEGADNAGEFVKACIPLLKRGRAPSIIITSTLEKQAMDHGNGTARSLASGLMKYGIRTNCIFSPPAGLDFNPDNHILSGRTLGENKTNPLDPANLALFLAMDDSFWINGQCIAVDGGLGIPNNISKSVE